jgi:hypothetical protein
MSIAEAVAAPSLTRYIEVTVWNGETPLLDADGRAVTLNVLEGSITDDPGNAIRRSGDLTLAVDSDGTLIPRARTDILQPLSNEIRVRYGIEVFGQVQWADLGVFGIEKPVSSDGSDLTLKVNLVDRAASIQAHRWINPFSIFGGTLVSTAIHSILVRQRPGLTYNLATTAYTVPLTVLGTERDNDPWKDAQDIAASAGMVLSFDPLGVVLLEPELDPATVVPSWEYVEGDNCTMTSISRSLDSERTYNGVIVVGEGAFTLPPSRAELWDTDPGSPTYYLGPFGKRPYFYTSPLVGSHAQAVAVAASLYPKVSQVSENVELTARANPFVRAGQVVRVKRARAGVDGTYRVDSVKLPLGADEMTLTMSERRA